MSESPESSGIQTAEEADAAFDAIGDEVPEPVEAPAEEESAAPELEETEDGPPRDDKGRFAKADQPETAPEAISSESLVEPTAEGEPEEVSHPTFRYRADGQEHELPGSAVGTGGVFFPSEQVPEITRLLQEGHAHRGSFQRLLNDKARQIQDAASERDSAIAERDEIKGKIEELIKDEVAFERFIADQRGNWEITKARAESAAHQKMLENERSKREEYEMERQEQQLRPVMHQRLDLALETVGKSLGLPENVLAMARKRMSSEHYLEQLFPKAQQDDLVNNVRKGQRYDINVRMVQEELKAYAELLKSVGPPPQQVNPKVAQAKAKAAQTIQKAPPTVSTKGGAAPGTGKKRPSFKSTEEVDDWFENDGFLEE